MLMTLEFILTAWVSARLTQAGKGWGLSIIPICIGFTLGLILGFAGLAASTLLSIGLVIDVCVIAALIWMGAPTRKSNCVSLPRTKRGFFYIYFCHPPEKNV